MDGKITVRYLQNYIKAKDCRPGKSHQYFLKLAEEVGELARAISSGLPANTAQIKGSVDEEIWDVIYYALAIANLYDIDVESVIPRKEALSNQKYGNKIEFEENR